MKRKNFRIIQAMIILILLIFILFSANWAETYYIDISVGKDSNIGTSENAAFRTIQRAADIMVSGDTCLVLDGNYEERVQISNSGRLNEPIVYQAIYSAVTKGFRIKADYIHIIGFEITETPAITGWGYSQRTLGTGIFVEGKYCKIHSNNIHDIPCIGIDIYVHEPDFPSTSYCDIVDNKIKRAGLCGINIRGKNHKIFNNDISHILMYPPAWADPPSTADADGIRFFGSGHSFRNNYIHDILQNANDPHIDFFQTWETAYDIIFEQNLCINPNTSGSNQIVMVSATSELVENLLFLNNIFVMYDPGYSPMNFMCISADGGIVSNIKIVNNTFIHPNSMGYHAIWFKNVNNIFVKNNIFYNYGSNGYSYINFENVNGIAVGYNCIFKTDGVPPSDGPFPNDFWMIDPKFMDLENYDFHLKSESPIIDSGINLLEVSNDFDGNSRPNGDFSEIGAYEYYDESPLPPRNIKVFTKDE